MHREQSERDKHQQPLDPLEFLEEEISPRLFHGRSLSSGGKVFGKLIGLEDAPFGDNASNEFGRRHVKRRIVDGYTLGRDRMTAVNAGYL